MNHKIELEIKNAQERADVGRILIANGYRVWFETRKGTGSTRVTLLCADRPGKEPTA